MVKKMMMKVTAALAATTIATAGMPAAALAVTQSEVDAAQAKLSELAFLYANADAEYRDSMAMLEDTEQKIDETQEKIDAKQEELKAAQAILSDRVVADYKSGGITLISLLMSSASFEELASNVYYADKVVEQDIDSINTVQQIQAELNQEQDELEQLHSEQASLTEEKRVAAESLAEREQNQSNYVNSLSSELKAQVAAADAARVQQEQQLAAAAVQAVESGTATSQPSEALTLNTNTGNASTGQQQSQQQQSEQSQQQSQQTAAPTPAPAPEPTPAPAPAPVEEPEPTTDYAPTYEEPSSVSTGSLTSSQRSAIVAAAYGQVGLPYGHTNSPGVNWDCSGLVAYCYASAGIPVSAYSYDQIGMIQNTSNLQPGDVIGWLGNVPGGVYDRHVALYIGGGMILHANGSRVAVEDLGSWSPYTNGGPLV